MIKRFMAVALALAVVFSAGSAMAFMASGTGDYTITLGNFCTVDTTAATTNFGNYPLGAGVIMGLGAGSVSVTCTNGLMYAIGANGGLNPNASMVNPNLPTMANGAGQYVAYRLYDFMLGTLGDSWLNMIDPAYVPTNPTGAPWGMFMGTGAAQTYALSADVYVNDFAQVAGIYTDTVTFTVAW